MKTEIKKQALRRLKIIEGQVKGLQKLVEEEVYCVDIINQASAVRQAVSSVEDLVLQNHLATHVVEQMKSGKHQKAIEEIVSIYKIAKKK